VGRVDTAPERVPASGRTARESKTCSRVGDTVSVLRVVPQLEKSICATGNDGFLGRLEKTVAPALTPLILRVTVSSARSATVVGRAQAAGYRDIPLAAFEHCGAPVEAKDLGLADPD
jgi:hypothetical protein